ncbi:MAG TPA: RIP metalloprotease RseP [Anaeromyxobacteraceae bacterium]|nr:RIP metalloprotease RseP [Anaeromyxobacteraceae bacterium]
MGSLPSWLAIATITVLAFGFLIVIHELGHFLAARLFGMRVERFSVGFGPVIFSRRHGDSEWALSAVPVGGYVKIAGMAPGEEIAAGDPGAYCNQAPWRRFLVILAGPAANYLLAIGLAVALIATLGLKEPDPAPVVGEVVAGGPADRAGLKSGDRVEAADGQPVPTWAALVQAVRARPGKDLALQVARPGAAAPLSLTVRPDDANGTGRVGMGPNLLTVRAGPAEALAIGLGRTNERAAEILAGLGQVVSRKQRAELRGPVGIAEEMARSARAGAAPFLMMVWLISIMLALFNFLPLPALDGGRLVFLAYEMVTRRPVNQRVEGIVHFAGFVALLGLLLAVTVFGDLARLLHR